MTINKKCHFLGLKHKFGRQSTLKSSAMIFSIYHYVVAVMAIVISALWRTGFGKFMIETMGAMADSYNDQYNLDDNDDDKKH